MIPRPLNIEGDMAAFFRAAYGDAAPNMPPRQYRELRLAFYAGVACLYGWMNEWTVDDEAEGVDQSTADRVFAAQMQMVNAQLDAFKKTIGQGN